MLQAFAKPDLALAQKYQVQYFAVPTESTLVSPLPALGCALCLFVICALT